MNSIALIRKRAMKSARRILIGSTNSSFCVFPPSKCHHTLAVANNSLNHDHISNPHYPFRILGFQRMIGGTQKVFDSPSSNSGLSRSFRSSAASRDVSTIARVAFKVQNFSTSVETRVSDNNFERIYIQGGMNVKPLEVESGVQRNEENVVREEESRLKVGAEDFSNENSGGDLNVTVAKTIGEDTDVERRAWKLLQDAVVTYCGNPVGTVAANDPGDKLPLNYDQVFLRDFIPSALAFLLKGENEVVKNFLLHTLQLQVIYYRVN